MRWTWDHGDYVRDYTNFYRVGGKIIAQHRSRVSGDFHPEWLPYTSVTNEGSAIMRSDGTLFTTKTLRPLGSGSTLREFVQWQWTDPRTIRFTSVAAQYPLSNDQSRVFRELCDAIVGNYPAILCRPPPANNIRLTSDLAKRDMQAVRDRDGAGTLLVNGVPTSTFVAQQQASLAQLAPVRVNGAWIKPRFLCGPSLTKLVQVWSGADPWSPSARRLRRALSGARRRRGRDGRDERMQKWAQDDSVIGDALSTIEWKHMLKAPSLSAYDTEFWHKVRLHQIYTWPVEGDDDCNAAECDEAADHHTTGHILWRCSRSRQLWQRLFGRWGAQDVPENEAKQAVFSWKPPSSTHDWLTALQDLPPALASTADMLPTRLEHWLDMGWTHLVTEAARLLWSVRVAEVRAEDPFPSSDLLHTVLTRWRRRLGALRLWTGSPNTVQLDRHILRALSSGFADPTDRIPQIRLTTDRFLLFFDGGSRGNPGPGGSGAVIVRARDDFEIIWMASMSFARRTTTNNYAEFQGLCTGLHAAVRHQWHPLTVIGDSAMILSLMRRRKSPKAPSLRPLYTQARQAAAAIRVTGWHHHYRAHNKMADKAANIAMDARRSVQAYAQDAREELTSLTPFLANDCEPWAERLLLSSRSPDRSAAPDD